VSREGCLREIIPNFLKIARKISFKTVVVRIRTVLIRERD
jgi:hypothetical protein